MNIKNLKIRKPKIGFYIATLLGIAGMIGVYIGLWHYGEWSAKYKRVWQVPVIVRTQKLTYVEERPKEDPVIISPILEDITEVEGNIEEYICEVFGNYNCQVAIAIMKAESNKNPEAWNANTNKTIDIGLWQINSVNWETCEMSMSELLDPYNNTDCAKILYDRAGGWTPWVVYNQNYFKSHL